MFAKTLLRARTAPVPVFARTSMRYHSRSEGPNRQIIEMLTQQMEEAAGSENGVFKIRAFAKAIVTIARLEEPVRSVEQVRDLDGIGIRIANRIDAFLSGIPYHREEAAPSEQRRTGSPPKEEKTSTEHTKPIFSAFEAEDPLAQRSKRKIISTFLEVEGIGHTKAAALYDAGCRSIADFRKPEIFKKLSSVQQNMLRYNVARHLMPKQALNVHDFVEQNISCKYTVSLCDVHCRGGPGAPYIALLILHLPAGNIFPPLDPPNKKPTQSKTTPRFVGDTSTRRRNSYHSGPFYTEIISPLESRGLIAAATSAGVQKWVGIIRIPQWVKNEDGVNGWEERTTRVQGVASCEGDFCRAEITYVSRRSAGAASIAVTGDIAFNNFMRTAASRLGYSLNEYGLWRWRDAADGDPQGEFYDEKSVEQYGGYWDLVEDASAREEDIFKAIGVEWVPRDRRNFEFIGAKR
ncbi:hypothetical protein BU15DRAFT_72762 [Melanogaster broomeanus]|nr:hypothetical protein BU15DRAFT_72762 [Melanogaster broomeanus]